MPIDPDTQHALFVEAVELLGSRREVARLLDVSERHVIRLVARAAPLHEGFLRDVAAALDERAHKCRQLERRLSPIFAENLHPDQPRATGRREEGRRRLRLARSGDND